jgi:ubiquinone/menaquinone biosynthesis C-methylase UbiE
MLENIDIKTDIVYWITENEIDNIFSGKYWNNEESEKNKAFYILDGNTNKLIDYLNYQTTYLREFESVIKFSKELGLTIKGVGLDIAAGVCWTTALLSKIASLKKIYAIEISKHRLLKIAPLVFDLFKAETDRIIRVIGSFYDIKLPNESIDFALMSQAFHHAHKPDLLLREIYRVLKPGGFILLIGEEPVYAYDIIIKYTKNIIKYMFPNITYKSKPINKIIPKFKEMFAPDEVTGDHYYLIKDYYNIFNNNRYELFLHKEKKYKKYTIFIAIKSIT